MRRVMASGWAAVALVSLVFTDVIMPGLSGPDLAQRARAEKLTRHAH